MNKRKFAKKKERERKAHKKVLKQREATRQKAREVKKWEREEWETRTKSEPFRSPDISQEDIIKKLQHNAEIMRALEEEHKKDRSFLGD